MDDIQIYNNTKKQIRQRLKIAEKYSEYVHRIKINKRDITTKYLEIRVKTITKNKLNR